MEGATPDTTAPTLGARFSRIHHCRKRLPLSNAGTHVRRWIPIWNPFAHTVFRAVIIWCHPQPLLVVCMFARRGWASVAFVLRCGSATCKPNSASDTLFAANFCVVEVSAKSLVKRDFTSSTCIFYFISGNVCRPWPETNRRKKMENESSPQSTVGLDVLMVVTEKTITVTRL